MDVSLNRCRESARQWLININSQRDDNVVDNRQFNIDLLTRKLRDAEELLEQLAFGDAMLTVSEVLVVAQERYLDGIITRARELQQRVLERLGSFKQDSERFHVLQDTIENDVNQGQYQDAARSCKELLQIAPAVRKKDEAKKYQSILAECESKLEGTAPASKKARVSVSTTSSNQITSHASPGKESANSLTVGIQVVDLKKLESKAAQLRRVEEIFQNEFTDAHYEGCLDILSLLIGLSEELANFERVELYKHLQKVLKRHLAHKHLRALLNPEMAEAIEHQKQQALQLELNLKFGEARKIYEGVLRMAQNLKEELTIALCEQKITQLTVWEEEMARSDLTKWTIPPFRILFRSRFDCLELLPDRASAEARKHSLVAQRVNPDSVKIVTIIRARFKNQGPFDATGTCHAVYIRRAWDFGE